MRFAVDPATEPEQFLDAALRPSHDAWLWEARRFLTPATVPEAPFWDRWSVVRYLNDQFLERLGVERGLVAELRPYIRPDRMDEIEAAGDRVRRLHLELDRLGRRRGTAASFAAMTEQFLEALGCWCAEIEQAVRRVPVGALAGEAWRTLAHLERAPVQRAG